MFKERRDGRKWRDLAARWASFEVDCEDHSRDMSACKGRGEQEKKRCCKGHSQLLWEIEMREATKHTPGNFPRTAMIYSDQVVRSGVLAERDDTKIWKTRSTMTEDGKDGRSAGRVRDEDEQNGSLVSHDCRRCRWRHAIPSRSITIQHDDGSACRIHADTKYSLVRVGPLILPARSSPLRKMDLIACSQSTQALFFSWEIGSSRFGSSTPVARRSNRLSLHGI